MSLRTLDLRGTPPPYERALPRPSAPGSDAHDVVARILRQVRAEGDAAVVRYTAELDRVDVSDGLRVPSDEIEKACADADPDLWRALEVAFARIVTYHAHEGTPPGDLVKSGITVSHLTRAVERAGMYAPVDAPATRPPFS